MKDIYQSLPAEGMDALRLYWRAQGHEAYKRRRARQLAARAAAEAQEAVQGAQVPTLLPAAPQGPSQADLRFHPGWPSNAKQPK